MNTKTEAERNRKIVYGYLTSGNSIWDLIDLFVDTGSGDGCYADFAESIRQELVEAREEPNDFETTVEEELAILEKIGDDHWYEQNTPASS